MEPAELTALAQKIQLVISEKEMPTYLEVFSELEKLLTNFKKLKIGKKVKPMTRIRVGYLTLSGLKKLSEKYTSQRIDEATLQANAEMTPDHFILFKKL